jgi:hypothetical protein
MVIYAYWPYKGSISLNAFKSKDAAAKYVFDYINGLEYKPNTDSEEYKRYKEYRNKCVKPLFDDATTLISLYEEYTKYALGIENVLHSLQETEVVE